MKKVILSLFAAAVILFQLNSCRPGADTHIEKAGIAASKEAALKILGEAYPLENGKYSDANFTEGESGYAWDDGSYYCFTVIRISENGEKTLGDIGSLRLVKKNTGDIYQLDLKKDINGDTLKRM